MDGTLLIIICLFSYHNLLILDSGNLTDGERMEEKAREREELKTRIVHRKYSEQFQINGITNNIENLMDTQLHDTVCVSFFLFYRLLMNPNWGELLELFL